MDLTYEIIQSMTTSDYLKNRKEIKKFFKEQRPVIVIKYKSYNSPVYQHDYYLKNIKKLKEYKKEYYKRKTQNAIPTL